MIAERVGLPPVAELFRLEGFQEPWELMCAQSDMSGEIGVPIIVAVRKHLVAEGWKMVHNGAMDSDTEEDDF